MVCPVYIDHSTSQTAALAFRLPVGQCRGVNALLCNLLQNIGKIKACGVLSRSCHKSGSDIKLGHDPAGLSWRTLQLTEKLCLQQQQALIAG